MELPVVYQGEQIGNCLVKAEGLYWSLTCRCRLISDKVERLYWRNIRLGVLEREGKALCMERQISQTSLTGFPGKERALYLQPMYQLLDCFLPPANIKNGKLWYRFRHTEEFPCMSLACFFSLEREKEKLYWTIPCDLDYSAE